MKDLQEQKIVNENNEFNKKYLFDLEKFNDELFFYLYDKKYENDVKINVGFAANITAATIPEEKLYKYIWKFYERVEIENNEIKKKNNLINIIKLKLKNKKEFYIKQILIIINNIILRFNYLINLIEDILTTDYINNYLKNNKSFIFKNLTYDDFNIKSKITDINKSNLNSKIYKDIDYKDDVNIFNY